MLAGTDTDGLSVLNVADWVALRIFQCDKGDDQVAFRFVWEIFVQGRDVG